MAFLYAFGALLVILAGIRARARSHAERPPTVTDELIRRIERGEPIAGPDAAYDPLDLDEIAAAEEEFWDETWDEPEGPL